MQSVSENHAALAVYATHDEKTSKNSYSLAESNGIAEWRMHQTQDEDVRPEETLEKDRRHREGIEEIFFFLLQILWKIF